MKEIIISGINIYQKTISPLLRQLIGATNVCRYPLSCSEFSKQSIRKYGIIKGLNLSLKRLLSCQPWYKGTDYGTII